MLVIHWLLGGAGVINSINNAPVTFSVGFPWYIAWASHYGPSGTLTSNWIIDNVITSTSIFPAMTNQKVCSKNKGQGCLTCSWPPRKEIKFMKLAWFGMPPAGQCICGVQGFVVKPFQICLTITTLLKWKKQLISQCVFCFYQQMRRRWLLSTC